MKIKSSILLAIFSVACYAQPQVYKHVDKDGKTSYSNAPLKDAKKLDLPPLTDCKATWRAESWPHK